MIPFVDLTRQYRDIADDVRTAVGRVLESGNYVQGAEVAAFEREFADFCGCETAVGVNSGTSALHLALLAAGVGSGDEVITVPATFVATVAAIGYVGARAVLVDVDPLTHTIDPALAAEAVTERTKAIVAVHLYGLPAEVDALAQLASARGITLIEDAAQAVGAEFAGRRAGGLADIGCFSFYPSKNLGACGEGGMLTMRSAERYGARARMLRDWGQERRYEHVLPGFNYRMDEIQAAILRVKLRHLDRWTEARRERAAWLDTALADCDVRIPPRVAGRRHVYHVYAVQARDRDGLQRALGNRGIKTGIHYPIPVHLQKAYANLGYGPGDFPWSERLSNETLSLPMFPELTEAETAEVARAVRDVLGNRPGKGR